MLATNLAERSATVTAERIARALAAPFETDVAELTITASIGISSLTENAEEAVLLVKLADEAMYLAKRSGKNRICCAARADDASSGSLSRARV